LPDDDLSGLFDRDDALTGLPEGRARGLVFLIESRVAHLVARSRHSRVPVLNEGGGAERDLAYVEAFALGRQPPRRPLIQDLELHAGQWAALIPASPRLRAAVARHLGQKYAFSRRDIPQIRNALGLDEPAVADAYLRLYRTPLSTLYATRITAHQRIRWRRMRMAAALDNLPPFWTAYALTLTETVGASILALPIAMATIGPLPGLAILVVLGAVNVITVAMMAEAITRSGRIRYGNAFFGRVVADYLGTGGSLLLTVGLFLFSLLALPVYYIGFARTLTGVTGIPAPVWVAGLFAVGLIYLRRDSLDATVASALAIGAVNVALILGLSGLALAHAHSHNLLYQRLPFVDGNPFRPGLVGLIFGVVLVAFFGHTSVALCGQLVLRKDPGGRSLVRGCAAAQVTAIGVYSLFVLAVNGAVSPQALAAETGTALTPLSVVAGPAVTALGTVFVVLGLGMGSITFGLALYGLLAERMPTSTTRYIILTRRGSTLTAHRRGWRPGSTLSITLSYQGLANGQPRFTLDVASKRGTTQVQHTVDSRWQPLGTDATSAIRAILPHGPDPAMRLWIEVDDADEHAARIRVTSTLRLGYHGQPIPDGPGIGTLLDLPDDQAVVLAHVLRAGPAALEGITAATGLSGPEARRALDALTVHGLVDQRLAAADNQAKPPQFAARPARRRGRRLSAEVVEAMGLPDPRNDQEQGTLVASSIEAGRRSPILTDRTFRFAVCISPSAAAFGAALWMAITGGGSFAALLNIVGVVVCSLLAGTFPVVLLVSSRRKGDRVPSKVTRWLGNPTLLLAVYLLFLASVLAHGLIIFSGPAERSAALAAAALIVALPIMLLRAGAFDRRMNIEVQAEDGRDTATFIITADGHAQPVQINLCYLEHEQSITQAEGPCEDFDRLRSATVTMPDLNPPVTELRIWTHRETLDQDTEVLPATLTRYDGAGLPQECEIVTEPLMMAQPPAGSRLRLTFNRTR
jgi:amino acid permease